MRKEPKKCRVCGDYMEPVFEEYPGSSHVGAELIRNPNMEVIRWICVNCS